MIIGVDFDNTIVCYGELFYQEARSQGLIPAELPPTKTAVRDFLRRHGREVEWTVLQGHVYGAAIERAEPFPDVLNFFAKCRELRIPAFIISHRTRRPYAGPDIDLHAAAERWIERNLERGEGQLVDPSCVFFEATRLAKIERIKRTKCTHFVDDLPEFLSASEFPTQVERILFDPQSQHRVDIGGIRHASSWAEIGQFLLGQAECCHGNGDQAPQASLDDSIRSEAEALLRSVGAGRITQFERIAGGRNNRVFKITTSDRSFLLKSYFTHAEDRRDRLSAEFSFSRFAWNCGIRSIPEPIAADFERRLAIFGWIDGRRIAPSELNETHVQAAANFFVQLNRFRDQPDATKLPNASEACFSMDEHVRCVERRLDALRTIDAASTVDEHAAAFVTEELTPLFETIRRGIKDACQATSESFTDQLDPAGRCLSPSDFGFHNALVDRQDRVVFFDFEYAGWDDPAKMCCDFFCQPEVPVPRNFVDQFLEAVGMVVADCNSLSHRVQQLLPLYELKWCTILLNEFLPINAHRREFGGHEASEERKAEQLVKARQAYQTLLSQYG